jgi:hypothetical protein
VNFHFTVATSSERGTPIAEKNAAAPRTEKSDKLAE